MKYYVVADVHGFYTYLIESLTEKGFFDDKEPHKLIVCGDLFDRGSEAKELENFVIDLMKKDEIILVRGNHEDLFIKMLNTWHRESYCQGNHLSNGTVDTVLQLTDSNGNDLIYRPNEVYSKIKGTSFYKKILPSMVDYFETKNYIFVHGWIPCEMIRVNPYAETYFSIENWRNANSEAWDFARWVNGMQASRDGVIEKDKTIVCGHWHCSYGHRFFEGKGSEFDKDADFTPYYANGIIAIDACTVVSRKINCLVIEE